MPELTSTDRLQPALLDRLADDEPHKTVEPRESRLISRQRLRQAVLRDLAWLFNSSQLMVGAAWRGLDHAKHSVINYGLPCLSGETASTLDVIKLEQAIKEAIIDFEPRIDSNTLQVRALMAESILDHHNQIQVEIRGNLWAQPVPLEMLLHTAVDLETGQVDIEDVGR